MGGGGSYGWVACSLACLVLWGLWGFLLKVASRGSPWMGVYFLSALASFALAVFAVAGTPVPKGRGLWAALVAGVFGGAGYVLFMKAVQEGKASVVIPLTALYPAVTVALAVLLLGEGMTMLRAAGIALAVIAAVLLSL